MGSTAKKMSRRLKARRKSLLQHYDDDDLHQLRIALRRVRSLLKGNTDKKTRRLRHDLGELAGATNPARDWDTLLIYAQNRLEQRQLDYLQPWLVAQQLAAHHRVLEMLRSGQWSDTVKRLKDYNRDTKERDTQTADMEADLARAVQQVSRAQRKALRGSKEKHWHKLRIAIKELRYKIQGSPKSSLEPEAVALISLCKRLQDDLGIWHDTVVHRHLLHELTEGEAGYDARTIETGHTLLQLIEQDGRDYLQHLRVTLEQQGISR